jgi:hypothetical protein
METERLQLNSTERIQNAVYFIKKKNLPEKRFNIRLLSYPKWRIRIKPERVHSPLYRLHTLPLYSTHTHIRYVYTVDY